MMASKVLPGTSSRKPKLAAMTRAMTVAATAEAGHDTITHHQLSVFGSLKMGTSIASSGLIHVSSSDVTLTLLAPLWVEGRLTTSTTHCSACVTGTYAQNSWLAVVAGL